MLLGKMKKLNSDSVKSFLDHGDMGKTLHKDYVYNTYKEYFRKDGKALVPIQPSQSLLSKTRKKAFAGERKMFNWEIFHRALLAEPMIFRSLVLKGRYITAYGYNYTYNRRKMLRLNDEEEEILDFFFDWDEYLGMSEKQFAIYVCCALYGNAFVEKVYDDVEYENGGWGIRDLKIIHPISMYVERDLRGKIVRYWQKPPNYHGNDLKRIKKLGGMPISKDLIVHFKWNDFVNETYGISDLRPLIDTISMKVGMREDSAIMVQQRADPIITWYVGDMEHPVASNVVSAVHQYIGQVADGSGDVVLPGFVKGEVLSTGDKMPNVNDYISMLTSEIVKGIGVPEVLLGEGNETTEATARIQMESFYGEIKYIQNFFSDKFRREVFVDIINPPKRDRPDRYGSSENLEIPRRIFTKIPSIKYRAIMSDKERMEQSSKLYREGIITLPESRAMIDIFDSIQLEMLHPQLRLTEEQVENEADKHDLEREKLKSQEKIAEKSRQQQQQQQKNNQNEKSGSSQTQSFP